MFPLFLLKYVILKKKDHYCEIKIFPSSSFRKLSSTSGILHFLGHNGCADVHSLHLAHVHDVHGSLLHTQISDEIRPQQDKDDCGSQDPVCVVGLHYHQ